MFRKYSKNGLPFLALAKNGFSLVELLVVITIIAILSVAAYTAVGGNTVKARDAKRKQDISTIQQALELYYAEKSSYPPVPLSSLPKKYLSDTPKDPGSAKHDYVYVVSGSTYEIGATLENDGAVANFQGYVVGNSDTPLALTANGLGRYNNAGTLAPCSNGRQLAKGAIGTSDADGKCVPYDPNN